MPKINQTTWIVALSTIDSGIVNELVEPEVPGIVNITNPEGGEIINFTAGTEGTSPITSYVATSVPEGPTLTVVSADLAVGGYVELSNFTFDTDYIVSISAVNEVGQGEAAYTNSFDFASPYNAATGGTETIVDDYNGTGEQWKVHTFTSSEAFEVASNPNPFKVLIVDGGQSGTYGTATRGYPGGAGGSGRTYESTTLDSGNLTVTVGGGSGSSSAYPTPLGGPSSVGALTSVGGTSGGGGGNSGDPASTGGNGYYSDVSGTNLRYAGGGGGGCDRAEAGTISAPGGDRGGGRGGAAGGNGGGPVGYAGTANTGGGGGGGGKETQYAPSGGKGGSGIVIVAYQIGVSTPAQIKVAQTVRKAELRKQQLEEKALKKQEALEAKLKK